MMKRIYFRLSFYFVIFIIIMVYVYGQDYQTFGSELLRIERDARWRFGPFRIYPSFQLTDVGYDNNVYQMSEEDDPIGDYTATASLPFTFYLPFRNRVIAYFDISPGYDFYLNEKQQSGASYSYSPGLRFLFFNRFVLSGSYLFQKQRRRPTVEFDRRVYVETDGYNASLFYEMTSLTAIGFSASISDIRYEDIEGDISYSTALNLEQRNGNFEFYRRIFTESDFFMTVGYSDYIFEDPESRWRDSYSYQVISGIRFPLLGRARGTLSLGYRWLINREDRDKRFSGLIGNTGLEFRVGRFNLRFQFNRDFQFSYASTNLYFIGYGFGTGLSFYLTRIIRLDYNFVYAESEYPEGELVWFPDGSFEEIARKDVYRTHSAGLVFRVKRNIGLGLIVTYWERDSNVEAFGRSRGFIGGYLTYDF